MNRQQQERTAAQMRARRDLPPKSRSGVYKRAQKAKRLDDIGTENLCSNRMAKVASVTLRQLQWWDEQGIIMPVHRSHMRIYSPADAARVVAIAQLRKIGLSLQRIRNLLRHRTTLEVAAIIEAATTLKAYRIGVK